MATATATAMATATTMATAVAMAITMAMATLVIRVLGIVLVAEQRLAGQHPNWTEVLGSVVATIYSQCG